MDNGISSLQRTYASDEARLEFMDITNEHAELVADIEQLTDIIEQKKRHAAELKQRAQALKETLQRSNLQ